MSFEYLQTCEQQDSVCLELRWFIRKWKLQIRDVVIQIKSWTFWINLFHGDWIGLMVIETLKIIVHFILDKFTIHPIIANIHWPIQRFYYQLLSWVVCTLIYYVLTGEPNNHRKYGESITGVTVFDFHSWEIELRSFKNFLSKI